MKRTKDHASIEVEKRLGYSDSKAKTLRIPKNSQIHAIKKEMHIMNTQNKTPSYFSGECDYTFDTFIVGDSNRFAHAISLAVAENRAHPQYNPLLIYGENGMGKTHLLQAIGHLASETFPDYNIVYVKCDDFTNELIEAIRQGKNSEFRKKYRGVDLLLMDDIQSIAGRRATQDEILKTFDTLYSLGKQIALTSDRAPSEMETLCDSLRSRFKSGVLADIQPPDVDLRKAIITSKATQLDIALPEEVKDYIAKNITLDIRQIEGAVKIINAYHEILDEVITVETASRYLKSLINGAKEHAIPPMVIIEETAKHFQLTPDDLTGDNRSQSIVSARQVAIYLVRKLTNLTLRNVGEVFGRDFSSVLSSIRRTENRLKESTDFAKEIKDIVSNINQ